MKKAREWVSNINVPTLFIIILLPFTPSAFMNFAFGVSNYSRRKYLLTLYTSKLIMIALLAVSLIIGVIGAPDTRGKSLQQITRERYGDDV